jgi:hypothetical protein
MSEKSYRGLPCTFAKSGPRKDKRGVDLISDALPFGRLRPARAGEKFSPERNESRWLAGWLKRVASYCE